MKRNELTIAEKIALMCSYESNKKDVWILCNTKCSAKQFDDSGQFHFNFSDGSAIKIDEESWCIADKEEFKDKKTKGSFTIIERWKDQDWDNEEEHELKLEDRNDLNEYVDRLIYDAGVADWDSYELEAYENSEQGQILLRQWRTFDYEA